MKHRRTRNRPITALDIEKVMTPEDKLLYKEVKDLTYEMFRLQVEHDRLQERLNNALDYDNSDTIQNLLKSIDHVRIRRLKLNHKRTEILGRMSNAVVDLFDEYIGNK